MAKDDEVATCFISDTLALAKSGERQASSSVRHPVDTYAARTPVSKLKQRTTHSGGHE